MEEIIIKTQKEWDMIPNDFDGVVWIDAPRYTRIIVAEQKGNSIVVRGYSHVEARGDAQVTAWDNAYVLALDNSSVEAWGNAQVAQYTGVVYRGCIKTHGNARVVAAPKTPQEYCSHYGIRVEDGMAILYKAVKPDLRAFHDDKLQYKIGAKISSGCDKERNFQYSYGLHVAHLYWALKFGQSCEGGAFKIIECAVPLDKIIVPVNTDGKVRTSELIVLREVPPEEWGIYGEVIKKEKEVNKL